MQKLNVDVTALKDIQCANCDSLIFTKILKLKYVSPLQTPDGKEGMVQMEGIVCVECGASDTAAIKKFHEEQEKNFNALVIKK